MCSVCGEPPETCVESLGMTFQPPTPPPSEESGALTEVHGAWREMMNAIERYKARVAEHAVAEARAPLEERIRELKLVCAYWKRKAAERIEYVAYAAENAKLREALSDYITANRAIAEEGRTLERVDAENEAWMRLLALTDTAAG